ncbi:DUF5009 domain-containing protein [uncultured Alistipes sp.]|jgi:hypothetical protein|uniref:acyltransferase family protein n=1 Tax=uncultured Alistipes sp. TaxID=538949 RepID=UPI0025DCA07C|nr:DUF5009 domain-containing protein [uncultured Alistipes sp.]
MKPTERLQSLDALRGFDMLFIMGLASLVVALCGLWPSPVTDAIAASMRHPQWDGFTHHDTIFPLFLFIAGVSFPFSVAKQRANNLSSGRIYTKIVRRMLILVLLGVAYNVGYKFDFANVRIASVLGRIGLAWGFAAILYLNFGARSRAVIAVVILIGYGLLSALVAAPDAAGAGALTFEGNLAGYIDRLLLPGRLIYGTFDPEGLLSTLPAVVTAMLGIFTGDFVRRDDIPGGRKALWMVVAAVAFLVVGLAFSGVLPINKKLWSSTFVCVVAAYSLAMFALFYYIIDVRGWRKWTLFFRAVGLNSITIYLAQRIISFRSISNLLFGDLASRSPEAIGAVVSCTGYVLVCWLFLYFLYRKNVFLKV